MYNPSQNCFVSLNCTEWQRQDIRRKVCQNLLCKAEYKKDENEYCVLHSPNKAKLHDFLTEFDKRINDKQTDFSYVYFPNEIFFTSRYLSANQEEKQVFDTEFIFNNATFVEEVSIMATFKNKVSFDYATFQKKVSFSYSTFEADVSFLYVEFTGKLYFVKANFGENSNAIFSNSIFKEGSKVWFQNTSIKGVVQFDQTIIEGFVIFQSTENHPLFDFSESRLNLRYAQIQGSGRIVFDKVTLYPNWFIDTDARTFIFVNPNWKNVSNNFIKQNVLSELEILEKRKFLNAKPVFKIACRQLAENAENNNRFEEASNFRQMAMETEWLEKKENFNNWIENLDKLITERSKNCRVNLNWSKSMKKEMFKCEPKTLYHTFTTNRSDNCFDVA
ncbi:MAG: pentapeptide repeat-containing protein, partial [Pyrinomonadaceae bacterium]|nr:pentapeptide repeat-containing protein [Pyrinomonadaceae bacterium]